jgi:hypothetical protein
LFLRLRGTERTTWRSAPGTARQAALKKQKRNWPGDQEIWHIDPPAPPDLKLKTHLRDPFCPRNFFGWGGEALCIKSAPSAIMAAAAC